MCQLAVKLLIQYLMSNQSLIRSRHHPSLSHPSILDIDVYLPQRTRFQVFPVPGTISFGEQMFLSAPSFEVWPRNQVNTPFARFPGCFGGSIQSAQVPGHTQAGNRKNEREKKKSKWSHIRCPRSLGGSFNKKMLWIPLKCYCSQFRYLDRSFSCIPSLLAEAYTFLCVWQEWYTTWRQPLKNDAALYISYSEWVCCQLALWGKKSYCIIRVSCVSLLSMW